MVFPRYDLTRSTEGQLSHRYEEVNMRTSQRVVKGVYNGYVNPK